MKLARYTWTGTNQVVAAGADIKFNGVETDPFTSYDGNGGIQIKVPGTYSVDASVTAVATATGTQAIRLYKEGTEAIGAFAADEADAVGDYCTMAFADLITVRPGSDGFATIHLKAPNATSVNNAIVIIREA